jgi:hypothetical protein
VTIATNAKIAGFTSLFYIAAGLTALAMRGRPQIAGTMELFVERFFFFAVGSTIFCWLLLTGRMIPAALAWLGLLGSLLLVVIVPVQRAGLLAAVDFLTRTTWLMWLPLFVFEILLGLWLIIKGVAVPARMRHAHEAA